MSDKHRATYHGLIADDETSARLSAVDEELPRGSRRGGVALALAAILITAGIVCGLAWGAVALALSVAP